MPPRRLLSLCLPNGVLPAPPPSATPDSVLRRLALWGQQYSPLTAIDPPDGIVIDITGCAHLFGGEAGLLRHIRRRLPGAQLAIADTAAAAWGLARYGDDKATALEALPLAALRLPAETAVKLRRVGIRRIGQLARLPRAELTAGYGPAPALRLDQALGYAPEPLRYLSPPPDWREIEHHVEPIFAPQQLQAALARLAASLCARLAKAELGVTALQAQFHRVDSQCPGFGLGFAAPCRDEIHIGRLLHEKLTGIDPGFGIEALSLTAATTERLAPSQVTTTAPQADYVKALDTVVNRLGQQNVWRPAPHASYIPEYAARPLPAAAAPPAWQRPGQPRPVRLFGKPDAITAMAPVPDDPPVMFTWRGKVHRVARATGPERIAREWWRHAHDNAQPEAGRVRDYYAVEDQEGGRFWIFRAGTHGGPKPVRWYLHGLFG